MTDFITSETKFSIVPEWVLYSSISDRGIRLYAVLARYANQATHTCFPARSTLAERLNCSTDSVDRALKELTDIGAVSIAAQFSDEGDRASNLYTVHVTQGVAARVRGGSRTGAAGVAAGLRPGWPHGCGTNESHKNESQLNDTRSASGSDFGAKAQKAIQAVIQEGKNEPAVLEAAEWLRANNFPIAAFRIRAHLEGKEQPSRDGRPTTMAADRTDTDWTAELATADPLTGEVPF